jgi:hypothetical protein
MKTTIVILALFITMSRAHADWLIKTYQTSSNAVQNLADADFLITNGFVIATTNMQLADMVGFNTGEGTGHFSVDNPVPGIPNTQATDFYAVQGTGYLVVPTTGLYTFGMNVDDGARLRLHGTNVIVNDVRAAPHDTPYFTVYLTAGSHPIEWTWYNTSGGINGGGAEFECYAAFGTYSGFDPSFALVGASPGLVVVQTPPPNGVHADIFTAVEINWNTLTNTQYQVQWSLSLSSTNWTSLGTPIQGTGTNISLFDSTRGQPQKFYRVISLP